MVVRIKELLKKNKTLTFIWRCLKKRNDVEFIDIVNGMSINQFFIRSFGEEYKGKLIYNIVLEGNLSGFFAIYRCVLNALYVSDRFGFIPFIKIINSYYNDSADKKDNVFSFYYNQPSGLEESNVLKANNVVEFSPAHLKWAENSFNKSSGLLVSYEIGDEYITEMARIRAKYLSYNTHTLERLIGDIKKIINSTHTIAIHYRGNAYKVGFDKHPVALEPDDYFEFIDECLQNGYEKIFIATDDANALNTFVKHYPNKVVYYDDVERSSDGIDVHVKTAKRENNGRAMGYEVLRDMYTLAYCDALICGNSQVTIAARIEKASNSKEFDYLKIIDKGFYLKDSKNVDEYYKKIGK